MSDAKIVERIVAEARARGEEALAKARQTHDQDYGERVARLQQELDGRRRTERRHAEEAAQQQLSARRLEERKKLLALKRQLLATGEARIIEDCSNRAHGSGLFWGAALKDGEWVGQNWLGELWMMLRDSFRGPGGAR